jgi:putative membrane protein
MVQPKLEEKGLSETVAPRGPAEPAGTATGPNLSLISTQLSWMRSDLSNLRTLLAWARTSVSMIGFGFTIYNFYRGFLENLANGRGTDAARNLGLALVEFGTLAMLVALWNFWSINKSLVAMNDLFPVPQELKLRWVISYGVALVLVLIGLITFLFMLRVI